MTRDIRHWQLRRENQDAINLNDTHGTHSEVVLRVNGEILYDCPEIIPAYVKEAVAKMFRVDYTSLIGFFSETGYNIWKQVDGKLTGGEPLYEAGNSRYDSSNIVDPARGEDLITLNRYCEQTGREMAEEMGLTWGGCTQESPGFSRGEIQRDYRY